MFNYVLTPFEFGLISTGNTLLGIDFVLFND